MRKPAFLHVKTKGQISCPLTTPQFSAFDFGSIDSKIPLFPNSKNFKPLAIFCGCTARFVSDLVRNLEDQFSLTQLIYIYTGTEVGEHLTAVHVPEVRDPARGDRGQTTRIVR